MNLPDVEHRPDTIAARPPASLPSTSAPVSPPIQLSSVYRIDDLDHIDALYGAQTPGFVYARDGHPNAEQLAQKIAALEGAEAALVCASGMAAESAALLACLEAGTEVALSEGVYGRTALLVARELARLGIGHTLFNPTDPSSLTHAITPRTRAVFVETLSNPLVRVADIPALAAISHAAGARLIVDHTFAPLLCRPMELGADFVVHSATKLISGHSDVTLGLLAGPALLMADARRIATTFGITGNAFESWLTLRGISTLALRARAAGANALHLAHQFAADPRIVATHYPGLPDHPDHAIARRLFGENFGAMLTIDLATRDRANAFIRHMGQAEDIPFAPSLGDVATTLSHPATTSHRGQDAAAWARQGITPGLVRVSVGVEDPADLWSAFDRGLDASTRS